MLLLAQNTTQSKHCVDNNSLLLCLLIIIFVALLTLTISVSACMYMYVCECVCVIVSVYVCLSMSVYVCVTVLSVCLSEVHTPIGVFIRRSACPYCFFFGLPVCLSIVGSVHEPQSWVYFFGLLRKQNIRLILSAYCTAGTHWTQECACHDHCLQVYY